MLPFTPEQEAEFEAATICGNYEKPFTDDNNKVRHHCRISGKFLFPCCNNCNLQLKPIAYSKKKRQDKIEKTSKGGKKSGTFRPRRSGQRINTKNTFSCLFFFKISKTTMPTSS